MVDFSKRLTPQQEAINDGTYDDYDPFNDVDIQNDGRWIQEQEEKQSMALELAQGQAIARIVNSPLPEYLIKLGELPISPEEKVEIDSLFDYGAKNARPFSKYINKVVTIIGACIHYKPPFQSYVSPEDVKRGIASEEKAGYNKIIYLLDEFDENGLPIFMAGSEGLANHTRAMLTQKGWFLWDKPVRYFITRGTTKGEPFTMINQDRVDRLKAERQAREEKKKK